MKKKKCPQCKKVKLLIKENYYRDKSSCNGFSGWCIACEKVYRKKAHQTPEYRKQRREYYHRPKVKEKIRKYQQRPEVKEKRTKYVRIRQREIKIEVIGHYGGICACCGEDKIEFLTLDHINNDGSAHRRRIGVSGGAFYRWVRNNGYPDDPPLQVLCWNCNSAKVYYGGCPHKKEKK